MCHYNLNLCVKPLSLDTKVNSDLLQSWFKSSTSTLDLFSFCHHLIQDDLLLRDRLEQKLTSMKACCQLTSYIKNPKTSGSFYSENTSWGAAGHYETIWFMTSFHGERRYAVKAPQRYYFHLSPFFSHNITLLRKFCHRNLAGTTTAAASCAGNRW